MNETATALAEFLNDFIGHVVPGTVLLFMLLLTFHWPLTLHENVASSVGFAFLLVAVSYGAGHMLSALHALLIPMLKLVGLAVDEEKWATGIGSDGTVQRARSAVGDFGPRARDLRNALMTLSPQSRKLAVRFQHVSLLYSGVALALWVSVATRTYAFNLAPDLLRIHSSKLDVIVQSATIFIVGVAALRKGVEFHLRSLRVPFSVGVAEAGEGAAIGRAKHSGEKQ